MNNEIYSSSALESPKCVALLYTVLLVDSFSTLKAEGQENALFE